MSPRDPALPPKPYFRIGEVSHLVGVEPHVLRYWEREFRSIRPTKSAKGQRVYSQRDVEKLLRVRELLYTQGFTIAGAKKQLQDATRALIHEGPVREREAAQSPALARGPAKVPALESPSPATPQIRPVAVEVSPAPPRPLPRATRAESRPLGGPRKELVLLREEIEALLCELSE